jgi:hypothetical protein
MHDVFHIVGEKTKERERVEREREREKRERVYVHIYRVQKRVDNHFI